MPRPAKKGCALNAYSPPADYDLLDSMADAYDQQPYFSHVFPWSAPGYIRAAAHLYGIQTPPVARARILEIGCAAGGNCIPIASLYPEAEVVGVDISPAQIQAGERVIAHAGLDNITLLAQCFSRLPAALGRFDYIIAHGVWSWVPAAMQQALLRVCQQFLSPRGVAYISYNTYPGWKLQEVFRDAMLFHDAQYNNGTEVERAREMIPFFSHGLAAANPLQEVLRQQARRIPTGVENDYYIAHEYLEPHNHPLYLHDFVEQLSCHGLRHVGDVELRLECPAHYGDEFAQHFHLFTQGQKAVARQQYLDFAVGRQFRKSLVVHQHAASEHCLTPDLSRLPELQFAGWFELQRQVKDAHEQPVVSFYQDINGQVHRITEPLHRLWLEYLHGCWPRPVSGRDLLRLGAQQMPQLDSAQLLTAFKQWFIQLPLSLCRSYEDLPACLHDLYEGLIPGIYSLIDLRHQGELPISDYNAWFQSSIAHFTAHERALLGQLDSGIAPALLSAQAGVERSELEEFIATLRKYAIYI